MNILDVAKIVKTVALVGSDLPAYKALFDQVVDAFKSEPEKQQQLQQSYDDALAEAKKAHEAAQAL